MSARKPVEASPSVVTRTVRLTGRNVLFRGTVAVPATVPWRSAAVVVGDAAEVDEFTKDLARRLAAEGHGAVAIGHDPALPPFARGGGVDRIDAALACLVGESRAAIPRYGVVGVGRGGLTAIAAGYRCRVGVAVSFYGDTPARLRAELSTFIDRPKPQAGRFVFVLGGEDTSVRPADLGAIREHLEAYGIQNTFIIYPRTRGAFLVTGGKDYKEQASTDAFQKLSQALDAAVRPRNRFLPPSAARGPAGGRTSDVKVASRRRAG
jgi:dienelactone hydrolase